MRRGVVALLLGIIHCEMNLKGLCQDIDSLLYHREIAAAARMQRSHVDVRHDRRHGLGT